jgi:nitrate/TMAO reductase-like tetraheme cytochrome c subunit
MSMSDLQNPFGSKSWVMGLLRRAELNNLVFLACLFALLVFARPVLAQEEDWFKEADFTSAQECGACHASIYNQWTQSVHSRALTDPLYQTVLDKVLERQGGRNKIRCLSCHTPVASVSGTTIDVPTPIDWEGLSPVAMEGVTCDFCHTISGREDLGENIAVGAYVFPRKGRTHVKYGPRSGSDGGAHPSEASEFLRSGEFCAICHNKSHPVSATQVQSTYGEWRSGPYAARGVQCQDCHMPGYTEPDGHTAKAHVFMGGRTEMVKKAATLTVFGNLASGTNPRTVEITASVRNSGAGHAIPTGLTGLREMWLEVAVTDPSGNQIQQQRFWFGQRLLGRNGQETFFWEEFDKLEENRIFPEQSAENTFSVTVPQGLNGSLRVEARLMLHYISRGIASELGLATETIEMASSATTISLDR